MYFWPHNWGILHILAILEPNRLEIIPPFAQMKVRSIVDIYTKTPLHYLIGDSNESDSTIHYASLNRMFEYILDFLEFYKHNNLIFFKTTKSLSDISTFLWAKARPESVIRYLRMTFSSPYTLRKLEMPKFGDTTKKVIETTTPIVGEEELETISKRGSHGIKYRLLTLYFDFNPLSEDSFALLRALEKLTNQDYFKTRTISTIIDYLWKANARFNYIIALLYSILTILISVNFVMTESNMVFQLIILALDIFFIGHEILQMVCYGWAYLKSLWNYFDMFFYLMIIVALITRFANVEDSLTISWIFTLVLIVGYGRWISYLRLFDLSSKSCL